MDVLNYNGLEKYSGAEPFDVLKVNDRDFCT